MIGRLKTLEGLSQKFNIDEDWILDRVREGRIPCLKAPTRRGETLLRFDAQAAEEAIATIAASSFLADNEDRNA